MCDADDIVSVLNLDCFMEILEYLTEPQDVLAFAQASTTLNESMEERGDLLKVLVPVLQSNQGIDFLLKLRTTHKRVKAAVDSYLHRINMHQFCVTSLPSYLFDNAEKMETFLKIFAGHGKSPFVTPSCQLMMTDAQTYNNALAILVEHGQYLECAELNLGFERGPRSLLAQLADLLTNLKNVERLEIALTSDFLHSPNVAHFPPCPKLTQLRLDFIKETDENQHVDQAIVAVVYNSLVSMYGRQLNRLCVADEVFSSEPNLDCWNHLSNIQRLQVLDTRSGVENWRQVFEILNLVEWNHLVKLELHFEGSYAEMVRHTLRTLSRFRSTLEILLIGGRKWRDEDDDETEEDLLLDTSYVDPYIEEKSFENLIKLNMNHPDDFSFRTWELVAKIFPNLETLIFREYIYVRDDVEHTYEHVKYFFLLFPYLQQVELRHYGDDKIFQRRTKNEVTLLTLARLELGSNREPEMALNMLLQNLPTDAAAVAVVVHLVIPLHLQMRMSKFRKEDLPQPVSLPACPNLNHLDLRNTFIQDDFGKMNSIMSPILSSLFRAYGAQLTKLSGNVDAFWSGLNLKDWDCLCNLQSLRVDINGIDEWRQNTRWSYVFDILCQVSWPKLEELSLGNAPSASWSFSYLMVMTFKNFQSSLKTLSLVGDVEESDQMLELKDDTPVLKNLTKLEIGVSSESRNPVIETNNRMWNLFSRHCPNLRDLDLVWISQGEGWYRVDGRAFYQLFPGLERVQMRASSGRLGGSWTRQNLP